MKYSSRFFLYAPLGLFLVIACAVGIHWWLAASALSARLEAVNGREIVPGVTMRFASRSITGFPFSLDTVFRGLAFRLDTPHGPTEWRPEEFAMHALTYGRDETIFEAAGKQELSWTKDDGSKRDLAFAVGSLHASAISDKNGVARFDLDIVGFDSPALVARRLQLHVRYGADDKVELAVVADGLRTISARCPTIDGGSATVRLMGAVSAGQSYSAFRAGRQAWGAALTAWRANGGNFTIMSFDASGAAQLRAVLAGMRANSLLSVPDLLDAVGMPR
jgi:hypothetical protein